MQLTSKVKIIVGDHVLSMLYCCHLTKDGFMFLVMGFTGVKAAELKINLINTFNEAQKQLSRTTHLFERQRVMFTW